jgi:hypothetical protein
MRIPTLTSIKQPLTAMKAVLHYHGGRSQSCLDPENLQMLADLLLAWDTSTFPVLPEGAVKNNIRDEVKAVRFLLGECQQPEGGFERTFDDMDRIQRVHDSLHAALLWCDDLKPHFEAQKTAERRANQAQKTTLPPERRHRLRT